MKFDVMNRFTGDVQITAEIDCAEDVLVGVKLGLAVRWAIKARADMTRAYLAGANLAGADMTRAYLAGAYLAGANLAGANLAGANLAGAKIRGNITINNAPVSIFVEPWHVTIFDAHMQIGCEFHSLAEWASYDDESIGAMEFRALEWWGQHKEWVLECAKAHGRG